MKILLVQTSFLGDVILSTPVVAGLKKLYPEAELWMMVTPAARPLIERDPLLSGILEFDKRAEHRGLRGLLSLAAEVRRHAFAQVYALQRWCRTALLLTLARVPQRIGFREACFSFLYHQRRERPPALHDALRNLCILGGEARLAEFDPGLRLFAPERGALAPALQNCLQGLDEYAVLVPGSAWATKRWQASGYRDVARYFLEKKRAVVLVGGKGEREVAAQVAEGLPIVNLVGQTSLAECMHVIQHAGVVVCNDSMAVHTASAFKVPTVAVFCATSPAFGFAPWQNRAEVVQQQGLACKPCRPHGGRRCPTGTEACMQLSSAEVIAAIERLGE